MEYTILEPDKITSCQGCGCNADNLIIVRYGTKQKKIYVCYSCTDIIKRVLVNDDISGGRK